MTKKIALSVLVIIILLMNVVNAATTKITLTGDVNEVNKGDTVTITLSIEDAVNSGNFRLIYDKKLLKYKSDNFSVTQNDNYENGTNLNFFNTSGIKELKIELEVIGNNGKTTVTAEPHLFSIGTSSEGRIELDKIEGSWEVKVGNGVETQDTVIKIVVIVAIIVLILIVFKVATKKKSTKKKNK